MERRQEPSAGRESPEARLDVLVDAALFINAVAAVEARPGSPGSASGASQDFDPGGGGPAGREGRQAVLIAARRQLAIGGALGEPYPHGRQLPAVVIRSGQMGVPLSRLARLVPVLQPGLVRLFGAEQQLHVTQTAEPSIPAGSHGRG